MVTDHHRIESREFRMDGFIIHLFLGGVGKYTRGRPHPLTFLLSFEFEFEVRDCWPSIAIVKTIVTWA